MTNDKRVTVLKEVSRLVAEALPKDFLYDAVEEAITAQIVAWKPESHVINTLLKEIVAERTRELLRTIYADKIDAMANEAALSVVNKQEKSRGY
jgi:hypothetical protein